jgi:hypothetical protein
MRVGRGDGSTDDADVCGLRTVRHTRPEVESRCVYMCGHGCFRGMDIRTRGTWRPQSQTTFMQSIYHAGRLIKRTITHMREGLSAWYVTADPSACRLRLKLDEASLLEASRVYIWWMTG